MVILAILKRFILKVDCVQEGNIWHQIQTVFSLLITYKMQYVMSCLFP